MDLEENPYEIASIHTHPNLCIHVCNHRASLVLLVILETLDHVEMWYVLVCTFSYKSSKQIFLLLSFREHPVNLARQGLQETLDLRCSYPKYIYQCVDLFIPYVSRGSEVLLVLSANGDFQEKR